MSSNSKHSKLKQLVKQNGTTLTELAKKLKVSRVHLTNIANGEPAGKKLALEIEAWSHGKISHSELLYPDLKN